MTRKYINHDYGTYSYLKCSTYLKVDRELCTIHTMRLDILEDMVLSAIRSQVALAVDMEEAIKIINSNEKTNKESARLQKALKQAEHEVEKAESLMIDLYPDWKSGMISKDEYLKLKERFEHQKNKALEKVNDLTIKVEEAKDGQDETNQFLSNFVKYKNIDSLTRDVVVSLIEMIYIYENKKVKIVFKYQDPFKAAKEYIENNKKLLGKKQRMELLGA